MSERGANGLLVAIDTASELAGVALTEDGALLAEVTWRTRQSHSRELLPALDWLLGRHERTKNDVAGLCVCLGPGSYAGLRVGISTAKALAFALAVPVAGVGRLAADAHPFVAVAAGRVFAVHAAGRAELAWAAYERDGDGAREVVTPRLGPADALLAELKSGDVVCGEPKARDETLIAGIAAAGAIWTDALPSRVIAVASLGQQRLAGGDVDDADTLVPLYLRAPAIGPQPPR